MGGAFPWTLHISRMSLYSSEDLPGNEGAECTRWTQEPRLTSFLPVVAVLAGSQSDIHAINVLLLRLPDTPPSSAAATRLLHSNPNFPVTAYLRIQKSGMFFALSVVVLTGVDRWERFSNATYAWPTHFSALQK